jgi:serine/threonine protein kinase
VSDADTVEARGDLTAAGAIMGTPDFISPEQAEDARQADIRSDIYSLGATLYFLLAGRPPFADGSVMHKLKSHAQAEPEPLESLRDDIPAELGAVVIKE